HLNVEQLIKHALSLRSAFPGHEQHLVYAYWEPTNAAEIPECVKHREEIVQLQEALGRDASPAFSAISYSELMREWEDRAEEPWVAEHVAALRARYDIGL